LPVLLVLNIVMYPTTLQVSHEKQRKKFLEGGKILRFYELYTGSAYCSNSTLFSATHLVKTALRIKSRTIIDVHLENGPE
ncbi:hypothetical protein T01_5633, partial [Trichinella spiralis]